MVKKFRDPGDELNDHDRRLRALEGRTNGGGGEGGTGGGGGGTPGADGQDGATWYGGAGAPGGAVGAVNDWYLNTNNGDVYLKTGASTWTLQLNIKGTAGTAGTAGSVWLSGSGTPGTGLGVVNDFYINTANADVYKKTGASTWTLQLNIKGANGAAGSTGAAGINAGPVFSTNTELTVVTGTQRWYSPVNCTISNVITAVGTAPVGSDIRVDVNKNGTTIFSTQSTRPTVVANTFSDTLSVPQVTAVAALDYLTIDIDAVGSTYPGANLTVQVILA